MIINNPIIHDEFGARPSLKVSSGEFGETQYSGAIAGSGDISLTSTTDEFGYSGFRGEIGGESVDVYVTRDEWGQTEYIGRGREVFQQMQEASRSSSDWM